MAKPSAEWVEEIDQVRLDIPGRGFSTSCVIEPDDAMTLMTAIKVALARRPGAASRRKATT